LLNRPNEKEISQGRVSWQDCFQGRVERFSGRINQNGLPIIGEGEQKPSMMSSGTVSFSCQVCRQRYTEFLLDDRDRGIAFFPVTGRKKDDYTSDSNRSLCRLFLSGTVVKGWRFPPLRCGMKFLARFITSLPQDTIFAITPLLYSL